jgi:hypothetical protein
MPERQVKHQKFKYTPGIASSALSRPPLVSSQGTPTLSPPTPLELHEYAPSLLPYLYCGTPCGGGPYPGAPPGPPLGGPPYWFIITPCTFVPPPNCCSSGSSRYAMSCQKLHTCITGMKQKVNHSHRFITRPVMLPQFRHLRTVCSAPLSWDVNANGAVSRLAGDWASME